MQVGPEVSGKDTKAVPDGAEEKREEALAEGKGDEEEKAEVLKEKKKDRDVDKGKGKERRRHKGKTSMTKSHSSSSPNSSPTSTTPSPPHKDKERKRMKVRKERSRSTKEKALHSSMPSFSSWSFPPRDIVSGPSKPHMLGDPDPMLERERAWEAGEFAKDAVLAHRERDRAHARQVEKEKRGSHKVSFFYGAPLTVVLRRLFARSSLAVTSYIRALASALLHVKSVLILPYISRFASQLLGQTPSRPCTTAGGDVASVAANEEALVGVVQA